MDYKTFTHDLTNYNENIKRLARAEDELGIVLYDLCGVRGISYDSTMVHGNPTQKALNWLTLEDRYNEKANEVERYRTAIMNVESAKRKLPKHLWSILVEKFVKGKTYTEIGLKYGYSNHGMWVYLKRETERYL